MFEKLTGFLSPYLTYLKIAAIVIACAGSFGAAWSWRGDIEAKHQMAALQEAADHQAKVMADLTAASQKYQTDLANEQKINNDMKVRLDDEVAKNSVYRSCVVPPSGVRALNSHITANTHRP